MPEKLKHTPASLWAGGGESTSRSHNVRLVALAPTAPHDCADPTCPGAINRRKLEAFDQMREALEAALTVAPHGFGCHSLFRGTKGVDNPPACTCWHRRGRAALAAAKGEA